MNIFRPRGILTFELLDAESKVKAVFEFPNGVTTVGKNHALNTVFDGEAPVTSWYIGLIAATGFTAVADSDTMASHAGWAEFTTYSQATRVLWNNSAASGGSMASGTTSDFDFTGTGSVRGGFITSGSAKSGTTGILWATALLPSNLSVLNGDTLRAVYSVSS